MDNSTIQPFRIDIPQADLNDLRDRISRTKAPDLLVADIRAFFRNGRRGGKQP